MKKRFFAIVVALILCLSLVPAAALAMDNLGAGETVDEVPADDYMDTNYGTVNVANGNVNHNYGTVVTNNATISYNDENGVVKTNTEEAQVLENLSGAVVEKNN